MQKPSILYVDDEQNNLDAFTAAFRRFYQIHTALSAKEGIELLGKNQVQVIITDQKMPGMTGTQFLESILLNYPDVMRIILTGYSDMEALIKAVNTCRIFRYITKPWNEKELKEAIDSALLTYSVEHGNKELLLHLKKEIMEQNSLIEQLKSQIPSTTLK